MPCSFWRNPFRPLFDDAEEVVERTIAAATAEDLILMKLLAARPQDDQDARGIAVAQQDHLDWDYCLQVAGQLEEAVGQNLVGRVRELREGSEEQ